MTKHSSVVGGSTAARLLNCPGSFQRSQALPPSADVPSEYAEEGTAMHAVMDALMRARMGGSFTGQFDTGRELDRPDLPRSRADAGAC